MEFVKQPYAKKLRPLVDCAGSTATTLVEFLLGGSFALAPLVNGNARQGRVDMSATACQ